MNSTNPGGGMHKQDVRNLIIFLACSLVLWIGYDNLVLKPQAETRRAQAVKTLQTKSAPVENPGMVSAIRPTEDVLAESPRIALESHQLSGTISLEGARIDDVELKNFTTTLTGKERVTIYAPSGTQHPYFAENGWVSEDRSVVLPGRTTVWKNIGATQKLTPETPVTLEWDNGQGLTFRRKIEIDPDYLFTITQSVINRSGKDLTLYPYSAIRRKGIPDHDRTIGYEGPIGYVGEDLYELKYEKLVKEPEQVIEGFNGWIGMSEKYWLTAFIPNAKEQHAYRFTAVPAEEKKNSLFQVDVRGMAATVKDGASLDTVSHLFAGAKKIQTLDMYETKIGAKRLDLAVDFGMLYFLTRPLYFLLTTFNSWVGNFGIAIIMLTLAVRFAVFPLASASYRSFAKMKQVAPKMTEIRMKYANDKPKLQQELVKLYETERVNPMAGCFPLILQIPIFFAVYKVISISIEMRHAPFFGWIRDLSAQDPLSVFNLFGLLPFSVPPILHIGPWSIAMLLIMIAQKQLNPPPTDVIQKDLVRFMPWIMTFVLSKFPSGLVIYWTFSNLISFLQQYAIMRRMGVPVYMFAKDEALAHEQTHKDAVKEVVQKVKVDTEYLKHRAQDVEEALFDAEDKLLDAAEGKDRKDGEKKL